MSVLKGVKFLSSSRGITKSIRRLKTIPRRFGLTPHKQINIIKDFVDCLKAHNVKGTFFVPAVLLERYKNYLKVIDQSVIEWGIHGFIHTDHSQLTFDEQFEQIQKAITVFDKHAFGFKGFRCPYLKFNKHTRRAIEQTKRFSFDSSDCIVWDEFYPVSHNHYAWMAEFYRPVKQDQVKVVDCQNHLTLLAVSLPDDDILRDREQFNVHEVLRIWEKILQECHKHSEVFVLQLHPERFLELKEALEGLIVQAKACNPPMWIDTMASVAEWCRNENNKTSPRKWPSNYQGVLCITGDIDAITITDFLLRLKEWK